MNKVLKEKAISKKGESILYIFLDFLRKKIFSSHMKTVKTVAKTIDDGFDYIEDLNNKTFSKR